VSVSSISGSGFGGLPTIGNREITTTIRLKDGETNMLAGLIRDDERAVLSGLPGLSDVPFLGRLFTNHRREASQTDIVLTLTPHIVRVLDLTEADLRPFRLGRDAGGATELPTIQVPPRDREEEPAAPAGTQPETPGTKPLPTFPQPLQPILPGTTAPLKPGEKPPVKKGGGGR
jgi:general secretion pathway protein D